MKLVTFEDLKTRQVGCLTANDTQIVNLTAAGLPAEMNLLIQSGEQGLVQARKVVEDSTQTLLVDDVKICAPLPRPSRNIMCVGKNYTEHAREFQQSGFDASSQSGGDIPEHPIVFTKAPSSVIAPGEPIPSDLDPTDSTDYEGELGVIIGIGGRGISQSDAMSHVYGYTIINDVTARYLQRNHKQWFLGKSIDGFCPMGPCIATADEFDDIREVNLTTEVNGEVRQEAKIAQLIFDIPTLIETISHGITLEPGDVIATGTPVGVGIGFNPPKFLKRGDIVKVTIDNVGSLENTVV